MAYTKILVIHNRLDKCLDYARDKEKTALSLAEAIDYALNRDKTEQACFETGINCDVEAAWRDMLATKRRWGKVQRKRQGYHIIQSFAPGEVTPEEAHAVGVEFAQRLFGERYEAIVTTHLNKAHLHNHVVVNSVSMLDGAMYRDTFQEYYGGGPQTQPARPTACPSLSRTRKTRTGAGAARSGRARPPSGTRCAVTLTPPWAGPIRCNPFYRNFGAWGIRSRPGTASIFPSDHWAGAAISGWTAWGTAITRRT